MDTNKDKEPQDVKKKNDTNVKRSKSKVKESTSNNDIESQLKRSFFGSRRKKKVNNTTDNNSSNKDQSVSLRNRPTIADAGLNNPPTNGEGDFEVQKGALMVTQPDAEEYFMKHPRRGKAIIFNQEYFKDEDPREGTKFDVERIKNVFGELLKFEIEEHNDLEYHDIISNISRVSKEDHTDNDCIAIFVLTHGKKGGEIAAKDMYYPVDKLWEYFSGDRCVTLAGKPKLFFISACRGRKKDNGIRFFNRGRTQTDSSNKKITYKIPNQADFLIAKSTVEGYFSYREVSSGTWFIQCLCEVISLYYETKDLMKMLTITSRKVALDYRSQADNPEDCEQTQIPAITTMLIRDVYFHKKE